MAVRREYISSLYNDLLGRQGSEGEISGWENAPDEESVRQMFLGSPEYTSAHGGQAAWQDVGGQITPTQPTPQSSGSNYQVQNDPGWPGGTIYPDTGSNTGGGTKTAVSTPSGSVINDFYMKYLGRPASASEQNSWLSGQFGWGDKNNVAGIERGISMSDEAARNRAANPQATIAPYTGFNTSGNDYSAFNTARLQDPGKSAKDAFAYLTNTAPAPPFGNKAQLANWFNSYIRPGMDALGHKVLSVNEDGFTYSNGEGTFTVDFAQNAGATPGSMLQRLQWNATPADAATAARYGGGTNGAAGGAARPASTLGSVRDIFSALGQQYGGPGGPGITTGALQQVGQDPLSQLITGALASFIGNEGKTSMGNDVNNALMGIILNGGKLPNDQVASRYESARELLDKGRRTMINDMRGDLASRNLLSEPGIPQGAEIGGIQRVTEKLAPEFSRTLRDIYSDESAKADTRVMTALQMASGLSSDQAKNFLAGIGEGTARQTALADLALRELQTNMAWNQFLAQFGLDRDKALYEIQNGGIDQLMPILQAFLQLGGMANGGYV